MGHPTRAARVGLRLALVCALVTGLSVASSQVSVPTATASAGGKGSLSSAEAAEPAGILLGPASTTRLTSGVAPSYPWARNKDGKACAAPVWPKVKAHQHESVRRVVILGDSLTRQVSAALRHALAIRHISSTTVCWGGKTVEWGAQQAVLMKQRSLLPQCVVVALGTNDLLLDRVSMGALRARFDGLLKQIGPHRRVFWVDLAGVSTDRDLPATFKGYQQANLVLGRDVQSRPNATRLFWSRVVAHDSDMVGEDGLHLSEEGEQARVRLIATAVAAAGCGRKTLS